MQEKLAGYFDLTDWGVVEITGPDAKDFLQRMSTVNLKTFDPSKVAHGAFLTGRGLVIALGFLQQTSEGFHFLVSPGQASRCAEHLEQFHFAENLKIADVSADWALFAVLADAPSSSELKVNSQVWSGIPVESWRDDTRSALMWVKIKRSDALSFREAMKATPLLDRERFELMRIKAGVPQVGKEVSDKEIILETGFDRAVARNKGCYPGQEVVERIFTYGSVNKKLRRVQLRRADNAPFPETPFELKAEGKAAGTVVSWIQEPELLGIGAGLAYVQKPFWEWNRPFDTVPGLEVTLKHED